MHRYHKSYISGRRWSEQVCCGLAFGGSCSCRRLCRGVDAGARGCQCQLFFFSDKLTARRMMPMERASFTNYLLSTTSS